MENSHIEQEKHKKGWYDRWHKVILLGPAIFLIFSFVYLAVFYQHNSDIILKDVSLTGGTSITVFDGKVEINKLKTELSKEFPDLLIRGIFDVGTGVQRGFSIDTKADVEKIKPALENYLGYQLTNANSSIEFSGATLSQGFYVQLIGSIISAFFLMAWVVFLIFSNSSTLKGISTMLTFFSVSLALSEVSWLKGLSVFAILIGLFFAIKTKNMPIKKRLLLLLSAIFLIVLMYVYNFKMLIFIAGILLIIIYINGSIPSFAVILCAFADIAMTLAIVDIRGMNISGAGIVAFLMLIGYSVDTDILLTSRLLKNKEGSINHRIYGAFKTGLTMTTTAIAAVGVSLVIIYNLSETLRQIFEILLIGLFFDIFNTWITNASLLKWYMEVKKIE